MKPFDYIVVVLDYSVRPLRMAATRGYKASD